MADGPGWRIRFAEIGSRDAADTLRGAYLETTVRPEADLARGEVYWHEVLGVAVRGVDGTELGVVKDIYRVAENEVYIVGGGAYGTFDVPAVRAFIRIFAPRRGRDRRGRGVARPAAAQGASRRPRSAEGPKADLPEATPGSERTTSGEASSEGGSAADPEAAAADRPEPAVVTLEIDVLTLFPAMIEGPLSQSIPGRIQEQGLATIRIHDLRDFGLGRHKSVDDTPYGGGAGMVMRVEPVVAAIESVRRPESTVILLDPVGEVFRHDRAADLATAASTWCSCARATRASTSGSGRSSTWSCRSATTSSRVASCRPSS